MIAIRTLPRNPTSYLVLLFNCRGIGEKRVFRAKNGKWDSLLHFKLIITISLMIASSLWVLSAHSVTFSDLFVLLFGVKHVMRHDGNWFKACWSALLWLDNGLLRALTWYFSYRRLQQPPFLCNRSINLCPCVLGSDGKWKIRSEAACRAQQPHQINYYGDKLSHRFMHAKMGFLLLPTGCSSSD